MDVSMTSCCILHVCVLAAFFADPQKCLVNCAKHVIAVLLTANPCAYGSCCLTLSDFGAELRYSLRDNLAAKSLLIVLLAMV